MKLRLEITLQTEKAQEECGSAIGQFVSQLMASGFIPTEFRLLTGSDAEKPDYLHRGAPAFWTPAKQGAGFSKLVAWGQQKGMRQCDIAKLMDTGESIFSNMKRGKLAMTKLDVEKAIVKLGSYADPPTEALSIFKSMLEK